MDIGACHVILTASLLDIRLLMLCSPAASIGWYLEAHAGEVAESSIRRLLRDIRRAWKQGWNSPVRRQLNVGTVKEARRTNPDR